MTFLVDADVIVTLCECDCIQYLAAALGCISSDIFLNSEVRRVCRDPKLKMSPAGRNRLKHAAATFKMINDNDVNESDFVLAVDAGANAGEAELFAAIDSFYPREVCIVTGDQQALQAIYLRLGKCDMRTRLMGNCICIEQLLKKIVQTQTFHGVLPLLLTGQSRLSFIKPFFTAKTQDQATFDAVINGRISSLKGACSGMLGAL